MSTWETTVYGETLDDIEEAAYKEADRFGVTGPLTFDIRPRHMSETMDGEQKVIDYEATARASTDGAVSLGG